MQKIGFIGCGKIAHFHADVLKEIGKEIVAVSARPHSKNILKFQEKYNIPKIYYSWKEMLKNEEIDAIWLVASWNEIETILTELIPYQIPIFAEKPIALSSEKIEELIQLQRRYKTKIQIGYNRRFYDFIPKLKNILASNRLRSVIVEIPESTTNMVDEEKRFLWIHNSSHIIDLLIYLLGDLDIRYTNLQKTDDKTYDTFNIILETSNKIPIHLNATWNTPANFSIKFYVEDMLYELKPMEFLNVYKGFEIKEPTNEVPVRRYFPRSIETIYANSNNNNFKPGFFEQINKFFGLQQKENREANLNDALKATITIQSILEQ